MKRIATLREFARRVTRALGVIHRELEQRIEKLILEGCPYSPDKIAEFVTNAIFAWEFRSTEKVVVATSGKWLR